MRMSNFFFPLVMLFGFNFVSKLCAGDFKNVAQKTIPTKPFYQMIDGIPLLFNSEMKRWIVGGNADVIDVPETVFVALGKLNAQVED